MVQNIEVESVMAQKVEKENSAKNATKKQKFGNFEFDAKHYLNTRLEKDEQEKEIVIRLLPFAEGVSTPFKKIHVHSVKMKNENGEKKWKKFMCPVGMEKSDKCPLCEMSETAKKKKLENKDDEKLNKHYFQLECMFQPKDYWLVRCIDRAHEDDGVKFWRFPDARNGDGIWDKIISLVETKKKRGVNILDINEGKDLVIVVKKQLDSSGKEKMVYQIQDDEKQRPLAETEEQMEKWINDPMKWDDVYTIKDYEYLKIVASGEYPVWNKEENKWVAKVELNSETTEKEDSEEESEEDYTTFSPPKGEAESNNSYDDDDDLPF